MKPWYSIEEFGLVLHYVMNHWEENNFPLGGKVQIDEPITPLLSYPIAAIDCGDIENIDSKCEEIVD